MLAWYMRRVAHVAVLLLVSCGGDGPPSGGLDGGDAGPAGGDASGADARVAGDGAPDGDAASRSDAGADADAASAPDASTGPLRLLVFTKTEGYRHASIDDGVEALEELAAVNDWRVTHTEDAAMFAATTLADYDVTVWLNTTGDVLDDGQQESLRAWLSAGHGFVGVHSATDTEYDWPYYGELLGAWFADHPRIQEATLHVEDGAHVATAHLDATWMRRDEWYNFGRNPRDAGAHVLVTIDEGTYNGGKMGNDHPVAWTNEHEGGRVFYTAGGHTAASYGEEGFRRHLAGGIDWAGRR